MELEEVLKTKVEKLNKINIKARDLNNEIKNLKLEKSNSYKTEEFITFLNTIIENNYIIKFDSDIFYILDKYTFYESRVNLYGKTLLFDETGIEYCESDYISFSLNENTIQEITKSLIKYEHQLFIKNILKSYLSFYEMLEKGEVN